MRNVTIGNIGLMKKIALVCALCMTLAGFAAALVPQRAYADSPTYRMSVVGENTSSAIAPGDSFTVALMLENNESSQYTMYAMSATVRYNTSMLEVSSLNTNNGIDVYTRDAGDGFTDAVLNFRATSLKGVTWDNGTPLMEVTFNALEQGSTSMTIQRVNISNSTGMGRYACDCTDAVITVSTSAPNVEPIAPSTDVSEGTTEGVEAPEADPSTLDDEDLVASMTDEEKAEYEATKNGEVAANASSSASGAADSAALSKDGKATGDDQGMPTVLLVLICALAVVVIALISAVIIHKRKTAQGDAAGAATGATTAAANNANTGAEKARMGAHGKKE